MRRRSGSLSSSSAAAPQCEQVHIWTGIFTERPRMDFPISRRLIHLSHGRANGLLWGNFRGDTIRQICEGIRPPLRFEYENWMLNAPYFLTTASLERDQDRIKHNNWSERDRHKEIASTLQIFSLPPIAATKMSQMLSSWKVATRVTFPCSQRQHLALCHKTIFYWFFLPD